MHLAFIHYTISSFALYRNRYHRGLNLKEAFLFVQLDMMESFKAEGLAYSVQKAKAVKASDALVSVQKRLDGMSSKTLHSSLTLCSYDLIVSCERKRQLRSKFCNCLQSF